MLAVVSDPRCALHDAGEGHPERPARLTAALAGFDHGALDGAVEHVPARVATDSELAVVHAPAHIERLGRLEGLRTRIDADTAVSEASLPAARLAAGAGLVGIELLGAGRFDAAFCVVRPPGHHATPDRAMGFCLFNNIAVAAAALRDAGERPLIVDFDAHHGNGTQDRFVDDPGVGFVSWHQSPQYPGTGPVTDRGIGPGEGTTLNLPLPAGTTGDQYLSSIDGVVGAFIDRFAPTWLLLSAGYDGHWRDPLCDLSLSDGDFGAIVTTLMAAVPRGRTLAFLEGGYDLDALRSSVATTAGALVGIDIADESPTSGGTSSCVLTDAVHVHGG